MTEETERLCPSCGNTNAADAQFCRECGAILIRGRAGAKRSAPVSEVESSPPPPPAPPGEIPLSPPRRRGGALAAILVATLLLVTALIAYQRHRAGRLPVPGEPQADVIPAVASPAEERPGVAAAPPLAAPTSGGAPASEESRAKPAADAPSEVAAAKPIPPASHEAAPASEEAPAKPARKRPAEPAVEPSRRRHTGWYRVRYRTPLFQSPSETAPVVTYLTPGTRIQVTRVLPGFLAVESTTGKPPGYVSSDDVLPDSVAGTYP